MYIYIPRARVLLLLLLCVFNCFLPTQSAHRETPVFPKQRSHQTQRRKKVQKLLKNWWTLSPVVCSCALFSWLLRRAFPSAFFSLFCLPFSLSLSFVVLWLFDIITKTRIHKNLIRPSSLSFSLSSDDEEEEDAEERGGVAFASSLICASFLSFWSSEERKRKARRENINFINFWGGVSGKAVTKTISSSFSSSSSERRS